MPEDSFLEQFEKSGLESIEKKTIIWKRMPYVLDHIFFNSEVNFKVRIVAKFLA